MSAAAWATVALLWVAYFLNYTDRHPHVLNLAGVVQLPQRFELGLNFSYSSAPPFSAYIGGIDFNGDGTTGDLLPGTAVNAFTRGMGRTDLERLVAQFNSTYPRRQRRTRPLDPAPDASRPLFVWRQFPLARSPAEPLLYVSRAMTLFAHR